MSKLVNGPHPSQSAQFRVAAVCLIIIVLIVAMLALQKHYPVGAIAVGIMLGSVYTAVVAWFLYWTRPGQRP